MPTAISEFSRAPNRIRTFAICIALSVLASFAFLLTLKVTGPQLSWDSQDYAQLARQVARGEGRTTKLLLPYLLDRRRGAESWPSLFRPPFPVFLTSLSFRLFGISDRTAVLPSAVFYVGTVVLIFLCFQPIHEAAVALLSAIVFALSGCGLIYARSGLTEPAAMFFLLCGFLFTVTIQSYPSAFLGGLSLGLCALNRPIAFLWALVFIVHEFMSRNSTEKRMPWRVVLLAGGLVAPSLLVKYILHWSGGGQTLFALNLAMGVGDPALAMRSPIWFVFQHPGAMLAKFIHEMGRVWVYLFQFGNVTLFSALSIFALFLPISSSRRDARNLTITLVFTTAAVLSFLTAGDAFVGPLRYFDVFTPILIPWGILALLALFRQAGARNYVIFGLLGIYLVGAAFQSIRDPFARAHSSDRKVFEELSEFVPEGEVVAATGSVNVPSIVWYGNRRAVLIEGDMENTLLLLLKSGISVNWYLGKESGEIPKGFSTIKRWPGGFILSGKPPAGLSPIAAVKTNS